MIQWNLLILSTSVQEPKSIQVYRIIEEDKEEEEEEDMASNLKPTFAYVVVYVKDVPKTAAFYAKAFGYNVRRLDQSCRYLKFPTQSNLTNLRFLDN